LGRGTLYQFYNGIEENTTKKGKKIQKRASSQERKEIKPHRKVSAFNNYYNYSWLARIK